MPKKLGISRNTINHRIKYLAKKEAILGFNLFLNPARIGYQPYKILLSLRNLEPKTEKRFVGFAEANKTVVYVHKNFGKWNAEFEVIVKTAIDAQNISTKLRELFEQDLTDLELFPIFKDYKINLLP